MLVGQQQFHGLHDFLWVGTATNIKEISRVSTIKLYHVHGGHSQPGTIDHTANFATEIHIAETFLLGFMLFLFLLCGFKHGRYIRMTVEGIVIESHFGINSLQRTVLEFYKRIDFGQ